MGQGIGNMDRKRTIPTHAPYGGEREYAMKFSQEFLAEVSALASFNRSIKHKENAGKEKEMRAEVKRRSVNLGFSSLTEMFDFMGKMGDFRRYAYTHERVAKRAEYDGTAIPRTRTLLRHCVAERAGKYDRKFRGSVPERSFRAIPTRKAAKRKGKK